ncbi:DNA-binding protein [Oscillibacter sp.]|uniref:DNA-binding protein n=1 Tax=Oscillibacter sp. TaxID=1945593 RepID=UPI003396BE9C
MKTAKCRDAPIPLTRKEAAAALGTSPYRLKQMIAAHLIRTVPPNGRVLPSELERFKAVNAKKIEAAQAEIIHAYEIGLSMNLVENVATMALCAQNPLLPGKPTARQFTYKTVYDYVMKEKNENG